MGMKPKAKKVYRSMQGKIVDLDRLIKRNELTPAVGNARVNARGDELGPGGQIVRKREEVVREYYEGNRPVADEVPVKSDVTIAEKTELEEFDNEPIPPKPATMLANAKPVVQPKNPAPAPVKEKAEWIEDKDGNFIKKGE
jgi:hypothetical protein